MRVVRCTSIAISWNTTALAVIDAVLIPAVVAFGYFARIGKNLGVTCCLRGWYAGIVLGVGAFLRSQDQLEKKNNKKQENDRWRCTSRTVECIGFSFG